MVSVQCAPRYYANLPAKDALATAPRYDKYEDELVAAIKDALATEPRYYAKYPAKDATEPRYYAKYPAKDATEPRYYARYPAKDSPKPHYYNTEAHYYEFPKDATEPRYYARYPAKDATEPRYYARYPAKDASVTALRNLDEKAASPVKDVSADAPAADAPAPDAPAPEAPVAHVPEADATKKTEWDWRSGIHYRTSSEECCSTIKVKETLHLVEK